ncbi:hypothetical protein F4809DRAFT_635251 [Biscogniauxia mediterranea]|nr:hypothetical protein F4809DRAFT_635251 [Biscogniauxia mediterranea]
MYVPMYVCKQPTNYQTYQPFIHSRFIIRPSVCSLTHLYFYCLASFQSYQFHLTYLTHLLIYLSNTYFNYLTYLCI